MVRENMPVSGDCLTSIPRETVTTTSHNSNTIGMIHIREEKPSPEYIRSLKPDITERKNRDGK